MATVQRDFVGYGNNYPVFKWPNNAKLAVQFVLNYANLTLSEVDHIVFF